MAEFIQAPDEKGRSIWVPKPEPKPQPEAKVEQQSQRMDVSKVTAEDIRRARLQRQDRDRSSGVVNHARQDEPQEDAWKLAYREMQQKRQRLDVGGHGVIYGR